MVEHALVSKGLMCEHAACRHLPRHKPRRLNFSTASYFLLFFWAIQMIVEHILLLWRCPPECSNGCFPGMQGFLLAQATLQLETSSVLLGKPISIARRKRAFERSAYEEVVNRNGVRQVEPVFTHQRGDGSFQLLYNTCPESDAHHNGASFESPPFYGCIGRLVSFSSEGKQVGGETTLDFRSLLAEARIVGYWTPLKQPADGVHSLHDAIFAVWAQRCRTVDSTCECTEAKCRVSLQTSTAKSAYLLFTNQTIFETYKGDRLCVDHQADKTALNKNPSKQFTFWLVEHTGWVCGREDMHGSYLEFDEQHPNGIRVGSVFAVRLIDSDVEKFEVIRPVWTRARLDYSFGFNALLGGPAKQIDPVGATEKNPHYAFTIRARSFDVVKGVSESRCFGVILNSDFQETSQTSDEIFPCKPCVYAAFVLHPQYQELMAVCEGTSEELSGIYVDGKRLSRPQGSLLSLPPTEMSVPVFVPDDFRAWKVFWKDVTEAMGEPRVTLNLGEWNQQLQLYFENLAPVEGIKATGVDLIFASFFGEDRLLVGYQDSMQRSTFLMECSSNGTRVPGNSLKVLRTAEASLLPPAPGAFLTRPAASGEVFWYSLWTEDRLSHDAQDSFLPIADSTREFRLVKATGSRKNAGPCKGGVGPEPAACDASCHRLQVYETNKTVGADDDPTCVYTDGTNFAETCFEGSCQFLPVMVTERSIEVTPDEQVDETLGSQMTPSSSQSVFEISLQKPAEVWAIRGFFVPHGYPEFTVTLLDTNRTIVYTLSTRLPALKYGNLAYWEWRDMQVYRIQYVQLQLAGNATRRENRLEIAEVQIIGRELPVCPSEGFFSAAAPLCSYDVAFLLKDASVWDCQGEWSEWSYCDSTCRATRFMNVRKPALYGGRPCQLFEKRACSVGPHCHHINAAIHDFRQRRQDCIFATSEWSECRNCRRLRINHRIREAAGDTELGCPPFFEMENCPPPCDSELADWSITPATRSWWTRLWLMMADSWIFFASAIIGCLIVGSGIVTVIYCRTQIKGDSDQAESSTPTFTSHQMRDEDVPLVHSGPAPLTEENRQERATIIFSDDVTLLTERSASLGKSTA